MASNMKDFVKETLGEELVDLMERLKTQILTDLFGPGQTAQGENVEQGHFNGMLEKLDKKVQTLLVEHGFEEGAQQIRNDYDELIQEVYATVAHAAADEKAAEILVCTRNLLRGIVDHPNLRLLLTGAHERVQRKLEGSTLSDKLGLSLSLDDEKLLKSVDDLEFLLFQYNYPLEGEAPLSPEDENRINEIVSDPALQKIKEFVDLVQQSTQHGIKLRTNDWASTIKNGIPVAHERLQSWKDDVAQAREDNKAVESVTVGMDFITEDRVKYVMDSLDTLETEKLVNELDASLENRGDGTTQERFKTFVAATVSETIPSLSVPEIEGERDKVKYSIQNLDLSGVKIPSNGTSIDFANLEGLRKGDPFVSVSVKGVGAVMNGLKWHFKQDYFPYVTGDGVADADIQDLEVSIGFQLYKVKPSEERKQKEDSETANAQEQAANNGDQGVQGSPAHRGTADPADVAVALGDDEYQPRLMVAYCHVNIEDIVAKIKGHWLSWLYNTLSDLFSNTVKGYLISVMEDSILETLNERLEGVNEFICQNWPAISSIFEIDLDQIPSEQVATARGEELVEAMVAESKRSDHYSVTFPRMGPIGIKFKQEGDNVLVDRLTRFRGNILPAEASGKISPGDLLFSCNGQRMTGLPVDRVILRLRAARRPLVLSFQPRSSMADGQQEAEPGTVSPVEIALDDQKLHMIIKETSHGTGVLVNGFGKRPDGSLGQAEACGRITVGMVMVSVNGEDVSQKTFADAVKIISQTSKRPIKLGFMKNPDVSVVLKDRPDDLKLGMFEHGYVIVTGFEHVQGPAEVQCGDVLKKGFIVRLVNNQDVTKLGFQKTVAVLKSTPRPLKLEFGPPPGSENLDECCTANFGPGPLGLMFYKSDSDRAAFKAYSEFPGPVKRTKLVRPGMVIQSINGEAVKLTGGLDGVYEQIKQATLPMTILFRDMELQQKVYGEEATTTSVENDTKK